MKIRRSNIISVAKLAARPGIRNEIHMPGNVVHEPDTRFAVFASDTSVVTLITNSDVASNPFT